MMASRVQTKIIGLLVSLGSSFLAIFSFFQIRNVPLTSIGISLTIIGLTAFTLGRTVSVDQVVFNRILIVLMVSFLLINSILALLGNTYITTYFLLIAIVYLSITLIFSDLYPQIRGAFSWINGLMFLLFLVFLVSRYLETPK